MIVRVNETRPLEIRNKVVSGFTLRAFLQAAAVNTVLTSQFLPAQVNVKCILTRMGNKFTIFQDTLEPLAIESAFRNGFWDYVRSTSKIVEVVAAVGAKELSTIPFRIDLGDVIDLTGDDMLTIEVTVNPAAFGANIDTTASFVEVDEIEGQGFEFVTPYIRTQSIKANESRLQLNLDDNIYSVSFINTDKSSVLAADDVLSNINLSAKGFSMVETARELKTKRVGYFPTPATADLRYQSFLLYHNPAVPLTGLNVDAQLNSANVNVSKNFMVWRNFYTDARLYANATRKQQLQRQALGAKVS